MRRLACSNSGKEAAGIGPHNGGCREIGGAWTSQAPRVDTQRSYLSTTPFRLTTRDLLPPEHQKQLVVVVDKPTTQDTGGPAERASATRLSSRWPTGDSGPDMLYIYN
jgi:hypothetical protein